MKLFRKQREAIGNFLLIKQLKRQHRQVELKKLNHINSAGIIFDASSENCRKEVKAFIKMLRKRDVDIKALGFFDSYKPEENFISDKTVYFATLNDFSFFFLPKTDDIKDFMTNPFDVLFLFSGKYSFSVESVVKLSPASLKVGPAGGFNSAMDLTFELANYEPAKLTEQIEHYMQ